MRSRTIRVTPLAMRPLTTPAGVLRRVPARAAPLRRGDELLGSASAERWRRRHRPQLPEHPGAERTADEAGELARATGLTTASITGVLDRLEEAGFVHGGMRTTGAASSCTWTRPAGCATSPRCSRPWSRPGGPRRRSTPTSSWPSSWASQTQLEQIMRERLVPGRAACCYWRGLSTRRPLLPSASPSARSVPGSAGPGGPADESRPGPRSTEGDR